MTDQSGLRSLGLVQGQVGTVVELLDDGNALVEFCDRNGATFALLSLPLTSLLRLAYDRVGADLRH
ncbi:DUF4926 domain-containing protein [Aquidulcibacter sp.]|uniref:DUF4926 domain-containing protein n=1 Tax=Aquidulcibacter sp. TaxID=2052990 RepID=UPI00345C80EC|nr:DUF4926 domain-containing protein [Aquidulcibacter sp.]